MTVCMYTAYTYVYTYGSGQLTSKQGALCGSHVKAANANEAYLMLTES